MPEGPPQGFLKLIGIRCLDYLIWGGPAKCAGLAGVGLGGFLAFLKTTSHHAKPPESGILFK